MFRTERINNSTFTLARRSWRRMMNSKFTPLEMPQLVSSLPNHWWETSMLSMSRWRLRPLALVAQKAQGTRSCPQKSVGKVLVEPGVLPTILPKEFLWVRLVPPLRLMPSDLLVAHVPTKQHHAHAQVPHHQLKMAQKKLPELLRRLLLRPPISLTIKLRREMTNEKHKTSQERHFAVFSGRIRRKTEKF